MKEANEFINLLTDYYQYIPGAYDNKYTLVQAELAASHGKYDDAMDFIDIEHEKLIHFL
ncbi:hypothetical protein MHK_004000 [Candidatus Magnetomorum sp. HK-1]|nr:hypothetical protein MHK_004000 [Candidatus Magnetomorum sp. HK-1]